MKVNKLVVLGGGVLGSQIAYQSAYSGIPTVIYDISDDAVDAVKLRVATFPAQYKHDLKASDEALTAADSRLTYTSDLTKAALNADVIIEAVPERPAIKEDVYTKLKPLITPDTLLLTNSSTLLPSDLIQFAPNPQRFLAMHFANQIWIHNVAEIMWAQGTPDKAIDDAVDVAKQLHMIPIKIQKEVSGYVMNSIFLPMIYAALFLWADGNSDPHSIDKDWMVSMGVDRGPFGFLDLMGLRTAVNIAKGYYQQTNDERYQRVADKLENEYVSHNKLGAETGEGFYTYPEPAYTDPKFIQP